MVIVSSLLLLGMQLVGKYGIGVILVVFMLLEGLVALFM